MHFPQANAQVEQLLQPINLALSSGNVILSLDGIKNVKTGKTVQPTDVNIPLGTDFLMDLELADHQYLDEIVLFDRTITPTENTAQRYTRYDYVIVLLVNENGTQSKIELKGYSQSNDDTIHPTSANRISDCINTNNDPRSQTSRGPINESNKKVALNAIEGELQRLESIQKNNIPAYAVLCNGDKRVQGIDALSLDTASKAVLMGLTFTKINYRYNSVPN